MKEYSRFEEISKFILDNLIALASGKSLVSEKTILDEPDEVLKEIYMGFLLLHEELEYKNERQNQLLEEIKKGEQLFRGMFENAPVGIAILNMDLTVYQINKKLLDIFMLDYQGTINANFDKIFADSEEVNNSVSVLINKYISEEISIPKTEIKLKLPNRKEIWIELVGTLIKDDQNFSKSVILIVNEITERKLLEHKLTDSNKDLEQFAYIASHDLQEPLRTISGYSELILQDLNEGAIENEAIIEWKSYLNKIQNATTRMQDLIDDLLSFSRLEGKDFTFESLDTNLILKSVQTNLFRLIKEKEVEITFDDIPKIFGIKSHIQILFQNLIENGIKYNKNKIPKIHIGFQDETKKMVFYVKDNGIGIEAKNFDQIFIIFKRLHHKSEYSGSGIGLSTCRKIVEKHQGKIWVESELGKGSTFYFSIAKK